MCGAFSFHTRSQALKELFPWLELDPTVIERYNIRPKQDTYAVPNSLSEGSRQALRFRFGIDAPWNPKILLFNTRDDKLLSGQGFWKAFKDKRCIVFADGFFEWKGPKGAKQPYYIRFKDQRPFAFAGVFKTEEDKGYFSIITTRPNNIVSELHDRMPVILPKDKVEHWLSPESIELVELGSFLQPYPDKEMEKFKVSTVVNSWKNEGPNVIEPIEDQNRLL